MRKHPDIFQILLIVIPCLMFLPELVGYSQFAGWDVTRLNLPLKWHDVQTFRESGLSGWPPKWNPYLYTGMPHLGESETGTFYPLNWILYFPGNFFYWANIEYILHFILAGLFSYIWLRGREIEKLAAFFGSVLFQTAPFLLLHISSMALLQSVVWFPLMLWICDRIIFSNKRKETVQYIATTFLLGGILFLIGNVQIVIYMWILSGFYLLGHIYADKGNRRGRLSKSVLMFTSFLMGMVIIGAVVWIPVIQFLPETVRDDPSKRFFYLGTWLNPGNLASAFVFPAYGKNTEIIGWGSSLIYVGLLGTVLSLIRILGLKTNWRKDAPVVVMLLGALFLAFGMYNPVWHLLIKLPLLDKFRYLGRFSIGVIAGLCALSSVQISEWKLMSGSALAIRMRWAAGIVALLFSALLSLTEFSEAMKIGVGVLAIDIIIAVLFFTLPREKIAVPIILSVVLHLVIMFPVGRLATMRMDDFNRITTEFFSHIKRIDDNPARLMVIDVKKLWQMDLLRMNKWSPQDYLPDLCAGNTSTYFKVQSMNPYTPLEPKDWHDEIAAIREAFVNVEETGKLDSETSERLQSLGVDYVVTSGKVMEIEGYSRMDVDLSEAFSPDARLFRINQELHR